MLRQIKTLLFTATCLMIGLVALTLIPVRDAYAWDPTVCRHGCQYTTIQQAIDNAQSGDTIHIREGYYLEDLVINDKSLTLKGDSRRETIIHGKGQNTVLTTKCSNENVVIRLSDMTITGGDSNNVFPNQTLGGGIVSQSCGLFIHDSNIDGNRSSVDGGGINAESGKVVIADSSISNNFASSGGGVSSTGRLIMIRSIVSNNEAIENHSAKGGGGILNRGEGLIKESTVSNNRIDCCRGSGISNSGTLHVINSTITNNVGSHGVSNSHIAVIRGSLIANNKGDAGGGGGVGSFGDELEIIDSFIVDNRARLAGGIFHARGSLLLMNSTVANNTAEQSAGGGILNRSNLILRKSLITRNSAVVGGGLFNEGGTVTSQHTRIVENIPDNCVGVSISCP